MIFPNWQQVEVCERDGYKIYLNFLVEHQDPFLHFVKDCGWSKDQYQEIDGFYWFCAEVEAVKSGYTVGYAHLGVCCYASKEGVIGSSLDTMLNGHMEQLIIEAIEDCDKVAESDFNPIY
jgi:hypothetical protein